MTTNANGYNQQWSQVVQEELAGVWWSLSLLHECLRDTDIPRWLDDPFSTEEFVSLSLLIKHTVVKVAFSALAQHDKPCIPCSICNGRGSCVHVVLPLQSISAFVVRGKMAGFYCSCMDCKCVGGKCLSGSYMYMYVPYFTCSASAPFLSIVLLQDWTIHCKLWQILTYACSCLAPPHLVCTEKQEIFTI